MCGEGLLKKKYVSSKMLCVITFFNSLTTLHFVLHLQVVCFWFYLLSSETKLKEKEPDVTVQL